MQFEANDDFKDFLIRNGIVTTAAAITIGIASATFIKAFVTDILMPACYFIVGKVILQNVSNRMYKSVTDIFGDKVNFDFDGFAQDLITWIFIVIGAFLIIEYVVRRWFLGLHKKNTSQVVSSLTPAHDLLSPSSYNSNTYIPLTPSNYILPELGELKRIPMTSGVYSM
jgi:large-conductance mechanosensitive channel|uniref:Large conductance mechanosensitive channel protein n=1 Tax=viral metagenome TaxID=1070528 RepID=A0A6C0BHJ1_9ZZZZ